MVNLMQKIPEARRYWIKDAQRKSFSQEIHRLEQGKEILPESNIRMYNPRLDAQGILRVHGRLGESSISTSMKRPILLPKDHGFTRTLVKMVHEENHHVAVDWCHFHIRQGYWIISSRQLVRKVLRKMLECQKANARRGQQIMASLPKERVEPEPPFSRIGVDYTGKLEIKPSYHSRKTIPAYLVVFTCFVTRAVHLEVVLSERTEDLLMAFKRMVNTRGSPNTSFQTMLSTSRRLTRCWLKLSNRITPPSRMPLRSTP